MSLCSHSLSRSSNSELWLLQLVLQALDVDGAEAGCCGEGLAHSLSLNLMDSSSASVELVRDAPDADGVTAVVADTVEGCWLAKT